MRTLRAIGKVFGALQAVGKASVAPATHHSINSPRYRWRDAKQNARNRASVTVLMVEPAAIQNVLNTGGLTIVAISSPL